MTTKKLIFIWLGTMLVIEAATLIVGRYFPNPPIAIQANSSDMDNDGS